jgi:hypothetical protein
VDVRVYDADGMLIGYTEGETAVNPDSLSVIVLINGEDKYVYLPEGNDYTVEIIGTSAGTMEYTVQSFDENSQIVESKSFVDIVIEDGKQFESAIVADDSVTDTQLCVTDSDGMTIAEVTETGQEIAIVEHVWDDGVILTAATCTEDGVMLYTCADCQDTKTVTIKKLGHDLVSHEAQAATCTAIGWEAYETCSQCNYTTYKEIAATGHDLTEHEAQAATCTAIGWEAYETCSECDYTTYQEVSSLGHNYQATVVDPTCTAKGYTLHKCSRCGSSYKDNETAMIAHSWNAGTVTTSPTCTTTGVKTYTCTVCKTTKTETIKALGHTYTTTVVKPTYKTEGYTLHECSTCHTSYKSDVTAKLSYKKGDVDGDGDITLKDVTLLFQYVNKQITKDKVKGFAAADVDGDNDVTLKDVTKLFQYVNQQINSL